ERGKLRAFHADVSASAMDFDTAVNAGVGENARDLRAGRLVKGYVRDQALTEECGDSVFCAIDELIGNQKFSGGKFFFQRADSTDRENAVDAEELERINVRAKINFSGKDTMSA